MKTVKYVPKDAKGDEKKFEGHVELRMPLFEERLELVEKMGLETDDDGKVKFSEEKKSKISFLVGLLKAARPFYVSVNLKRLSDGAVFESYEDLSSDSDCQGIITEVAGVVMNGLKVGNG